MTQFSTNTNAEALRLKRYLLGGLSAEEQEKLERRLLTDNLFYEQIEITEEELIDWYLCEDLSMEEREGFERHFLLASDRRQRLRFARMFARYLAARPLQSSSWKERVAPWLGDLDNHYQAAAYSLAATLCIVALGAAWMTFKGVQWRRELHELQTQASLRPSPVTQPTSDEKIGAGFQQVRNQRNALAGEVVRLAKANDRRSSASIIPIQLLPGLLRDSSPDGFKRVEIPYGVIVLRLVLDVGNDVRYRYQASLDSRAGLELARWESLTARNVRGGVEVTIETPAVLLPSGDYQITLRGLPDEGKSEATRRYYFRIVKS